MSKTKNKLSVIDLLLGLAVKSPKLETVTNSVNELLELEDSMPISIGAILEKNAIDYTDKTAILYEDLSYTHFEFNALVNRYAHVFQQHGIKKGTVAVVFLENRLETLVLISALAKLGAIASLINANLKGAVLKHSIETDQEDYFIIGEERIADFEAIRPELSNLETATFFSLKNHGTTTPPLDYLPLSELIKTASTENLPITKTITLGDRFANVFTSGTTGMPKASIQTHKKWYLCYHWYGQVNMGIQSDDVFYVPIPFFHINAMIVAWPSAASGGAALAIRRKLSISNFWKDVAKFNVSAFIYIGEICRYLMNKPPAATDTTHRIQKVVGNGLRPDIWKAFKKRFNIPQVYELYGASDGIVSYTNVFNLDCTVGLCRSEYAIVRYDVDNDIPYRNEAGLMEKVAIGEAGLLLGQITEATPFPGYVNKAKNQEKILRNVLVEGDQWFNTGDLIRDLGFHHAQFVDRLGDTFRWKGENVSTAELEAILNQFPQVAHSAVYGVGLPKIDGKAGMATINNALPLDKFDFQQFTLNTKKALPSYAVPIFLRFVADFEKTATHKIKKSALKKEGIYPQSEADIIYVLLPKAATYTRMTPEIAKAIEQGIINF
ncbi:MAG: long-chain-acyl-CoA synthetase [Saprospiraceae bacterium]